MGDKVVEELEVLCGNCAAFPCFRTQEAGDKGGYCFQKTRRCRQECDSYSYKKYPAEGGVCLKDNSPVGYEDDCHIPEMMHQKRQ